MLGIRVERGEGRHGAYEHAHGVGVILKALHELLDVLVDVGVVGDVVGPLVKLVAGGQLTEENEIRRLQEVGALGQLLDGVAAVLEDTAFAVDVRDGAAAGSGIGECRVIHHQPKVILRHLHLTEIHRPNGTVRRWDLVRATCAVIGYGERVVTHGTNLPASCMALYSCSPAPHYAPSASRRSGPIGPRAFTRMSF